MRMSCNGCRVLRKGCSEDCSIRPCLQWIKSPEAQANATVFLAKFYGRAGLMNLINAGPDNLRPAIFRSLLYEACGRIVNPIYGSVGLLWSGSWQLCQAAVEAVLKGDPITQIPSETAASAPIPPLKAYDIRHVSKDPSAGASAELHRVAKARNRFKRSSPSAKPRPVTGGPGAAEPVDRESAPLGGLRWAPCCAVSVKRERSHESLGSHASGDGDSRENESMFSVETEEASHVSQGDPSHEDDRVEGGEVELDLTLGLEPVGRGARADRHPSGPEARWDLTDLSAWDDDTCGVDLGLEPPAAPRECGTMIRSKIVFENYAVKRGYMLTW